MRWIALLLSVASAFAIEADQIVLEATAALERTFVDESRIEIQLPGRASEGAEDPGRIVALSASGHGPVLDLVEVGVSGERVGIRRIRYRGGSQTAEDGWGDRRFSLDHLAADRETGEEADTGP